MKASRKKSLKGTFHRQALVPVTVADPDLASGSGSGTNQNLNVHCVAVREWSKTAYAFREFFPATDDAIIAQTVQSAIQQYHHVVNGHPAPILSDLMVAEAVHEAHFKGQNGPARFC